MSADFDGARGALTDARAAAADARLAAWQATESRRALERELAALESRLDPQDGDAAARRQALEHEIVKAQEEVKSNRGRARSAAAAALDAAAAFAPFSDPRENIGRLSDRSPMALLPVRIETRFRTLGEGEATRHELWVRIYPDDCSIDTFEPTLSTTEVANAKRYWQNVWRAGGVEADERAAWRDLVAAHGSGRAGFIVDTYAPVNPADAPVKTQPVDEILVIGTQTALIASERDALAAYWSAFWHAAGDAAGEQAAADALTAAVGAARAAELLADYVPFNLADAPAAPATPADVAVTTAFLVFAADPPPKQSSWSQAPQVRLLPERFVVLGYVNGAQVAQAIGNTVAHPLYVGPDPSADPSDSIHPDGEDLVVPDELLWMVDFERAVADGVGIVVPLTPELARSGFDRLLVLGVQMATGDREGPADLGELLDHHRVGRSGLSLIAQGTPTHNTTGASAGSAPRDDPDRSFDDRRAAPLFAEVDDPFARRDGQRVADALGVDPSLLAAVHGADGTDQLRGRAMQRALWPATLGYWMDKMLTPVFGDETVALARRFFTRFVLGQGAVPAVQIGGQAYGILPTTAFSRIGWLRPPVVVEGRDGRAFERGLLALLRAVEGDWEAMSANAAHVGRPGDAHQTLLDVVGHHPASVEFHWRYAETLAELYNVINLWGLGPGFWEAIEALQLRGAGIALLARLGYDGSSPPILDQAFMSASGLVENVIDDRALSESDHIRSYTDDGRNYIRWLIDAARTSLAALAAEEGFTGDRSPEALLYLYLRHALQLGYYDTSYELHRAAGFLSAGELSAMKPEPAFVHLDPQAPVSESRYAALFKTESRITQSPTLLVADYIAQNLAELEPAAGLADQLDALAQLADAPTAQLERLFAEHVDVCSYRFDAWLLALAGQRLEELRAGEASGVHLGAYAWVEDLRPSRAQLEPVELPAELEGSFGGPVPLVHDPANGGFVHAPSLPHARTAAVLRAGYLANAGPESPDTLSVNLSSDRVRLALSVLEGIRNGQSLGALLGYRFERGLHDRHGLAEVDKFIYPLRKAFPLVADSLASTRTDPNVPVEAIEARNVLDGRKLIAQIESSGTDAYPFGVDGLPAAGAAEAAATDAEVAALLDVNDAIADLALAEGVHQAVQGNFDRVGATLDAYTSGNFPPDPEVVQTPTAGIGLSHRVALHLRPGLNAPGATPRGRAEPAVDAWLASILPPFGDVGCVVTWTDPLGGGARSQDVTLADLGLRPLDLLELVKPDDVQAMAELDDRILRFVFATAHPRGDAALQIGYQTAPAHKRSIFEVSALVRRLRALVLGARPLRATDAMRAGDALPASDAEVFVHRGRIAGPAGDLDTLAGDVATFLGTLQPLVADAVANRAALVAGIDGFLDAAVGLLERAARFGLPQSGWGFAYEWRRGLLGDLLDEVRALVARWDGRLADFGQRLLDYDALPSGTPVATRFKDLQAAEALVTTVLDPLPPLPATLRGALPAKGDAMQHRRDDFAALLTTDFPGVADALDAVRPLLPVGAFDAEPFELASYEDRVVAFAEDLAGNLAGHAAAIADRRTAVTTALQAHDDATTGPARAEALQAAAAALLGESFTIVPEFELPAAQGAEWANALGASTSGELLQYLTDTEHVERPVQEWLTGLARVRPMLHAWEGMLALAGAFGRPEPALVPMQLPYQAGAPWLAMQFPDTYVLDSDRVLYTAHYSTPFAAGARQCGLLLDEWTEVVPSTTKDTGLTFHFDRPENEPPQSILLVVPATADGTWHWEDVVGALHETLDLAKRRALEPADIDPTAYSRLLPATIMAVTLRGISITTSLAVANGVLRAREVTDRA